MHDTTPAIIQIPVKHKLRVANPRDWWKRPLPANVALIHRPAQVSPTVPLPALGYLILALQEGAAGQAEVVEADRRPGHPRTAGGHAGDRAIEASVQAAMTILLAGRRGRI